MKTLAEFKRVLAKPDTTLTIIKYLDIKTGEEKPHKFLDQVRTIGKLQTNSVALKDSTGKLSWLDIDKARNWTFTDNGATYADGDVVIVYLVKHA
jgi:ribosomal protein L11